MSEKRSERFNKPDADVTFRSSDGVLFALHKENLFLHADGFPPADSKIESEIIDLPEDSATLNLLFRYVYPKKVDDIPDLSDVSLDLILKLSYAVEKYVVYMAMPLCKMRLLFVVRSHVVLISRETVLPAHRINEIKSIASFAIMHSGYTKILDEAAPWLAVAMPLSLSIALFPGDRQTAWALYREQWADFHRFSYPLVLSHQSECGKCRNRLPDLKLDHHLIFAFQNRDFFKCDTKEKCLERNNIYHATDKVWNEYVKLKAEFSSFCQSV